VELRPTVWKRIDREVPGRKWKHVVEKRRVPNGDWSERLGMLSASMKSDLLSKYDEVEYGFVTALSEAIACGSPRTVRIGRVLTGLAVGSGGASGKKVTWKRVRTWTASK